MRSQHDTLAVCDCLEEIGAAEWSASLENHLQRIDDRIPDDTDRAVTNTLAQKRNAIVFGRGKMNRRQSRNRDAVHLFRIRAEDVPRAQSGFHVSDCYAALMPGNRASQSRCRIALD